MDKIYSVDMVDGHKYYSLQFASPKGSMVVLWYSLRCFTHHRVGASRIAKLVVLGKFSIVLRTWNRPELADSAEVNIELEHPY